MFCGPKKHAHILYGKVRWGVLIRQKGTMPVNETMEKIVADGMSCLTHQR